MILVDWFIGRLIGSVILLKLRWWMVWNRTINVFDWKMIIYYMINWEILCNLLVIDRRLIKYWSGVYRWSSLRVMVSSPPSPLNPWPLGPTILHLHDMSSEFSLKNRSSVRESFNFEPIRATLVLSDCPIFSQERTEGVYTVQWWKKTGNLGTGFPLGRFSQTIFRVSQPIFRISQPIFQDLIADFQVEISGSQTTSRVFSITDTVTPYFDTEIEYMKFKNNPDDIYVYCICKIIG